MLKTRTQLFKVRTFNAPDLEKVLKQMWHWGRKRRAFSGKVTCFPLLGIFA